MRKIVEKGYDKGDYSSAFRNDQSPNKMERFYLDKLIELLPENAKVLDLGSGLGIPFDRYLVERGMEVTGIDISKKHVNQAKKNVPEARFIKGDFSNYEFQEKFDAIISFYAIFHIPRDEHNDLFLKMYDSLNEKGLILLTLGAEGFEYDVNQNFVGVPMAWSQYSANQYEEMLKKIGFKIIEAEFEGTPQDREHHFWVLAKKMISLGKA